MTLGLEFGEGGLCRVVSGPAYGRQDLGYAPGGPADRFAAWVGNALLDQDRDAPALEVVHLPELTFTQPTWFVLSGAPRERAVLVRGESLTEEVVSHAEVVYAIAGDRLRLGKPLRGLRTYVCVREAGPEQGRWVLRGAAGIPGAMWDQAWRVMREMSDVGLRLELAMGNAGELPRAEPSEITSGPVSDGTVQLTAKGPLVLLRQRPTLGGYPRVGTVIDVDIDRLAQYRPGQALRFRVVSVEEAVALYRQREEDLLRLIDRLG